MTRRKIAAGNWKMNKTPNEGLQLAKDISAADRDENALTILATPYTHLAACLDAVAGIERVEIAAQNCHHEKSGAYTGEISAEMLSALGLKYVIIGHSERRTYFAEDDNILTQKVDQALAHNMTPIFCCGESLDIRKSGNHVNHVRNQIETALFHLSHNTIRNIIIAYEPIWAIGTGETATPDQAQEMHKEIRESIAGKYGAAIADQISILYGGSVKPANARSLFSQPDVDGGLVGGASLNADGFVQIINSF